MHCATIKMVSNYKIKADSKRYNCTHYPFHEVLKEHRRVYCCRCVYCCSCVCVCVCVVILCVFVVLCMHCCFFFFTLDAGLLARSQYSEGPKTGHLDTGFSWFPCVYKQILRWFQDSKLPLHASHVALPT